MSALGGIRRARAWQQARRYAGPKVTGTRLNRALPAATLGIGAMAGMTVMVSNDVMAVNFTTSDNLFQIYSNYVAGVSAGAYLSGNPGYSASSRVGVAELGIKQAKLSGFCAIVNESLLGVPVSLVITAGTPVAGAFNPKVNQTTDGAGNPITTDPNGQLSGASLTDAVTVTDMFLNTNHLTGYGNRMSGMNLGQDAATTAASANLNNGTGTWPSGQNMPVSGNFGLSASTLNISGLNGSSYGVNLHGAVTLPHVRIVPSLGAQGQGTCPTQAQ